MAQAITGGLEKYPACNSRDQTVYCASSIDKGTSQKKTKNKPGENKAADQGQCYRKRPRPRPLGFSN